MVSPSENKVIGLDKFREANQPRSLEDSHDRIEGQRSALAEKIDHNVARAETLARREVTQLQPLDSKMDLQEKNQGKPKGIQEKFSTFEKQLQSIPQRVDKMLAAAGVDVYSDEPLTPEDIAYIARVKGDLDPTQNRRVKVVIANEKNWSILTQVLGMDADTQKFNGQSLEVPIAPDGAQCILLPSSEVFRDNTEYKTAYETSKSMKDLIAKNPDEAYRNVYLRNILAHELSHLYQFSEEEKKKLLSSEPKDGDPYARDKQYNEFLDLREFLAVAYGYHQMSDSGSSKYTNAFLEANIKNQRRVSYRSSQAKKNSKSFSIFKCLYRKRKIESSLGGNATYLLGRG
ncbi:hypothetical protein HZA38_06665 [Candidatus Peregrinibacteria bacterium]|nr:hypothetical protein [Candidatus Peregrinibacteria bacterium]